MCLLWKGIQIMPVKSTSWIPSLRASLSVEQPVPRISVNLAPSATGCSTPHALLAFPPLQCPDLMLHWPVDLSSSAAHEAVRSYELSDFLSVPLGSSPAMGGSAHTP